MAKRNVSLTEIQGLIQRWLDEHDEASASMVMTLLYPQVHRIVRNHLPRGMDIEDLEQEVFIQIFQSFHSYDFSRPVENWISRVSMNVCLKALRSKRRRPEWSLAELGLMETAALDTLLANRMDVQPKPDDTTALLFSLLEYLTPEDRTVIVLLHLEEHSIREISDITGWNTALIKVRAFRARRRLRKLIQIPANTL